MTTSPSYRWNLRQIMAGKDLWKTSQLGPLLEERGVILSSAQVYRLVANTPERLSLQTLAALCDIFSCTPSDLIELTAEKEQRKPRATKAKRRPRRARVSSS
jgi:DNA-binding Xre family transcriptional regulator